MDTPNKAPLGVTDVNLFKQLAQERKGKMVELPSGIVVKLGKPYISDMIAAGDLPGELISTALGEKPQGQTDKESAAKSALLMAHIAAKAVLEPKVILTGEPDYDKGEVSIKDFSDTDRMFIYAHVQEGVVNRLNKFRDDSPSTPAGSDLPKVPGDKAKPAPKSK